MGKKIHIALSFDENYLVPAYALLSSIFHNNDPISITLHLIAKISEVEHERLEEYIRSKGSSILFYEVNDKLVSGYHLTLRSHWSIAVYYKIFFPELVSKDIDKLLYLDIDMLVLNKIDTLFDEDLGKFPVGAVYDNYVKSQELIDIAGEGEYFNSGMLLFNLPVWRAQNVSQESLNFLTTHPEKIIYVDQDALNATLKDNWHKMDKKYNLLFSYLPEDLRKADFDKYLKDKVVIHFTLQRPWYFLSKNRFRYLFFYYLKMTPKANERVVVDFSLIKLFPYLRIRLIEWYVDTDWVKAIWRKLRHRFI